MQRDNYALNKKNMTVLKEPYPHLFYIPPGVPVPTGALAVQQGSFLLPATHLCTAQRILQQFDFIRMGLLAPKTLIKRQTYGTMACPACWGMGTYEEKYSVRRG